MTSLKSDRYWKAARAYREQDKRLEETRKMSNWTPEALDLSEQLARSLGQEPPEANEALNAVALNDIRWLVGLDKEKRELKAKIAALEEELKSVEARRKVYEESLTEQWIDGGVNQVRQDGHTVSLRKDTYASINPEFKLEAPSVFMAEGLGHMLTVNGQLLRSFVLAHQRAGKELDESIKPLVNVSDVYTIRTNPSHKD